MENNSSLEDDKNRRTLGKSAALIVGAFSLRLNLKNTKKLYLQCQKEQTVPSHAPQEYWARFGNDLF